MAKRIEKFICSNCGHKEFKWAGKCSSCGEFNTFIDYIEEVSTPSNLNNIKVTSNKKSYLLKDVKETKSDRAVTGISEFDRVMGGGIVSDSINILSAPPGAGKSTLCLQVCDKMIDLGKNVLYASGEESRSQIKNRANRIKFKNFDKLWILDDCNMDLVVQEIKDKDIDFFILDSINSYYLNELLPARPNNPSQVLGCAETVKNVTKNGNKPISCIIIGQMTKEDELAGSRALEHLVDAYLRFEGEREEPLRILTPVKNRFGSTEESGFFNMTEEGLEDIENPSEFFMTERNEPVIGSSLTVLKEGSRPIVTEIESLISNSFTPYPSRIADSLRKDQLNILISILEQRANINLYNKNVVLKTGGNIKLKDAGSNLSALVSIASSFYKKPIPLNYVYIADVGLTGELKKVQNVEQRIRELDRMGYSKVFIANGSALKLTGLKNIEIVRCNDIKEVLNKTF